LIDVDSSYRLGLATVGGTLLLSFGVSLAAAFLRPTQARAAHDLGERGFPLGEFRLVERSGRAVSETDLAGDVWVASFIFTRCQLSCPRISGVMNGLQGRLAGLGVRLVSISVDPEHDTPEVLSGYASRFRADGDRWWFLTGARSDIHELITGRFKLGLVTTSPADQEAGAEAFVHSDRLALVVRNSVIGVFDSNDPKEIEELVARACRLGAPAWVRQLPALNATLNGTSALLLAVGWVLIRTGNIRAHAACMLSAISTSSLFLASYLIYHFHVGSVPFQGAGVIRLVYFSILLSHTLLATFGVVPLVATALVYALRRKFDRHSRVAKLTFPIWMYVSLTGVIIYVLLYQIPVSASIPHR
jgi:protein SCO1/2/putative membrane protein